MKKRLNYVQVSKVINKELLIMSFYSQKAKVYNS